MKTLINIILLSVVIMGAGFISRSPKTNAPIFYESNNCDSFFMELAKTWRYSKRSQVYTASTPFEKWDYRKCFESFSQKDVLQCLGEPSLVSPDSQVYCYNTLEFYGGERKFQIRKFDINNKYHKNAASCRQIRFIFDSTKKYRKIELNDKCIYADAYCPKITLTPLNYQAEIKKRWQYDEKTKVYIWTGDEFSQHLNHTNYTFDGIKLNKTDIISLFFTPNEIQSDTVLGYKIYSNFHAYGLNPCKGLTIYWSIFFKEKELIKFGFAYSSEIDIIRPFLEPD